MGVVTTSVPLFLYLLIFYPAQSSLISSELSPIELTIAGRPFKGGLRTQIDETDRQEEVPEEVAESHKRLGGLNVHLWSGLCGWKVDVLKNWPTFPFFPDKRSFIWDFHKTEDSEKKNYGERTFGFIHPGKTGKYKFAITSDDTSELWLSVSENPLESKIIARVHSPKNEPAWTTELDYMKYPEQISEEISLQGGKKYYIEAISKQESRSAHLTVLWTNSVENSTFEIISSEFLSSFSNDRYIPPFAGKHKIDISPENKKSIRELTHAPFISTEEYINKLQSCPYNPSYLVKTQQAEHYGASVTSERVSLVYPPDESFMFSKFKWSQANAIIDKNRVNFVVDKLLNALQTDSSERGYYLKSIYKIVMKPDVEKGDRFLVDLILGMKGRTELFRLTEHVYQEKGSYKLCLPEGLNWNSMATVYFIIPVKNEGKWVHHFVDQITSASELTDDTNFHVIIVDFESSDIDLAEVFDTPLLKDRHTIKSLPGRFYKTLALNKAVASIPNEDDIIFVFELHIDVPADLLDSIRKNTIAGRIAYFPMVGRLVCGSNVNVHQGFWEWRGYGIFSIYKSDWRRIGGMDVEKFEHSWGGEDWEFLDRTLAAEMEAERIKYPGLYHHYHDRDAWRKKPQHSFEDNR